MQDLRSLVKTSAFIVLVFLAAALHAQDGLSDAAVRVCASQSLSSSLFSPSLVTADFNSDKHPDAAVLFRASNTFRIEVHLSSRPVSQLRFASNLANLAILAVDLNHDGSPDLVVEEPFSRQRLFVWLNDGHGSFHPASVDEFPSVTAKRNRGLVSASHHQECLALAFPGKLKIREVPTCACPVLGAANLASIPSSSGFRSTTFLSTPNLLRGPPSLSHL